VLIKFHFEIIFIGGSGVAVVEGGCSRAFGGWRGNDRGLKLSVEFGARPYHLYEFAASEFEVNVLVVTENRRIICFGMFKSFVNVAIEDGCAYFYKPRSVTSDVV
jgi:hypothetical protein